jgi:hypothetical protein
LIVNRYRKTVRPARADGARAELVRLSVGTASGAVVVAVRKALEA